jgi:hypothetical protein
MNASRVHAVLAAGLQDPLLVARWEEDPQHLLEYGIDPSTVDLIALRKFAGLTAKVRHNGLRQSLPLTFRLLDVAGLEIEVFSAYAAFRAGHGDGYAPTTEERTRALIAFLDECLDRGCREHVLLWDLIRHEDVLARLAKTPPPRETPVAARLTTSSVLRVRGQLELYEMGSDPRAVGEILRGPRPVLSRIPFGACRVGYWRPEATDELRIVDLDEFAIAALSLVDGARSVADLSAALTGRRRPSRTFLSLLAQLGEAGLLGT